jgi:molybdate transport system substrate-binding protein
MRSGRRRAGPVVVVALTVALAMVACGGDSGPGTDGVADGPTVTVFAAASLTEAFTALGRAFEKAEPGTTVELSFGPSSELAGQIAEGAPADVLASADERTMDTAVDAGVIRGTPEVFAANELEIAVPEGNPADVDGLGDFTDETLVIGLCAVEVPCGALAQRALDAGDVEASVDTFEPDVKSLLAKVASGDVDAGLVYRTDVSAADDDVDGIGLPDDQRVATRYPIAAVAGSPEAETARAFVDFVASAEGAAVLDRFGFTRP